MSHIDPRRRFLAAAATLAAGSFAPVVWAGSKHKVNHFTPGGTPLGVNNVTRTRFGCLATGKEGDGLENGTIAIPKVENVFMLPLTSKTTSAVFSESNDVTLMDSGQVLINNKGLYRISICIDWPAQHGVDRALRYYGVCRQTKGQTPIPATVGSLTNIRPYDYDRLAILDMPSGGTPAASRAQLDWEPGAIAAGEYAYLDVVLPDEGVIVPGDVVQASLSSLTDSALGLKGNIALDVTARVIKNDTVRVVITNSRGAKTVSVPSGTLSVLAQSSVNVRGTSADGWDVLQTNTELLLKGERIFGVVRADMPGDYMQITDQTYLQVERWA